LGFGFSLFALALFLLLASFLPAGGRHRCKLPFWDKTVFSWLLLKQNDRDFVNRKGLPAWA
jgi:hypothetical protein